jgi:mannose-6-phosphate isomerase
MDPLTFTAYLRPQVWGGRRLAAWGKQLPPQGTFGESWEISGHPHHESRVADGPLDGRPLNEVCAEHGQQIFGHAPPARFPLLIKLLDCEQNLSVQVHPDDERASELAGDELGKTEAWVILDAEPTARIYAGLRPGTTRQELERRLDDGTVAECLHQFTPRPGDCVFLRAGTVHAVGGGVVMAEVQQTSDATFRLFDWNRTGADGRPRALHREQSLRSIDWQAGPVDPVRPAPLSGLPPDVTGERLVACPYFEMERFALGGPMPLPRNYVGRMSIWMVLAGAALLAGRIFHRGQTVLIPASAPPQAWVPSSDEESTVLLGVRVP